MLPYLQTCVLYFGSRAKKKEEKNGERKFHTFLNCVQFYAYSMSSRTVHLMMTVFLEIPLATPGLLIALVP